MADEAPGDRVRDGTAWAAFCERLARAGGELLRPDVPADPLTRAEGVRYLTRLLRAGLESCVESGDPRFPVFYSLSHETLKIGADNPDNRYLNASIDGRREYRIHGTRGTVHYLAFSTKAGGYDTTGGLAPTGFLDSSTLAVAPDGRFEIVVGSERRPGNWLPTTADSTMLIVRQTFLDRAAERPAELAIEPVARDARPEPLDPDTLAHQLERAARFVEGTAGLFAEWTREFARRPNQLPATDQGRYRAAGGDPSIHYYHGYWTLGDEEALVVDVPRIPECDSWNFQLNDYWMQSLDYRHHRIHVNKGTAVYRPDGGCTIVVAQRDPGVPNWLDTAGHRLGTMCFRWIGAAEVVHPETRVTPLAAIGR
jgi:hypothetical protein